MLQAHAYAGHFAQTQVLWSSVIQQPTKHWSSPALYTELENRTTARASPQVIKLRHYVIATRYCKSYNVALHHNPYPHPI